jgi:photosystem II stability/assembly factor-like uncharacterized protein
MSLNKPLSVCVLIEVYYFIPFLIKRGAAMKNRTASIFCLIIGLFVLCNFTASSAESPVPVIWTTEGSTTGGLCGGEIKDIQISSTFKIDHTIFISTNAGVFKSTDSGETWINLFSYGPYYAYELAMTKSFLIDQTIFATHSNGLVKSTDGGISWYSANVHIHCSSVAVSPNYDDDQTVFAGSMWDEGVVVSTNGGETWSARNNGLTDLDVQSLVVSPDFNNDHTVFAGTTSGIFKSEDGGQSWHNVLGFTRIDFPQALAISPNYAQDKTVIFGLWNGLSSISTDGGLNWNIMSWNIIDTYRITAFVFSPKFSTDQTIFAGTISGKVLKSTDGGTHWFQCTRGLPREWVQSLGISPEYATDGIVFAGFGVNGDGPGLFKTEDSGTSWHAANGNMNIQRHISSLAIYQDTDGSYELLAGTDRNDVFHITSNIQEWSTLGSSKGGIIAVSPDYDIDQTIFAASCNDYYVYKSTDGGISWLSIDNGLPYNGWWDIAVSPAYTDDRTLFVGGNSGIYKSTDAGISWTHSRQGLIDPAINEIEISPDFANDKTLYAGGNNFGVFKSTDGGMNWQSTNQGLPVSPGYDGPSITSLAISSDFASSRTIFASVEWQGTYRSTDAGANWQQIYSRDASAIGISPSFAQDQTLFLKTYTGWTDLIAMSRDGGQTWEILDTAQLQLSFSITSILVSKKFAEDHMIFCAGDIGVWKGIIEVVGPTTTIIPTTTTIPVNECNISVLSMRLPLSVVLWPKVRRIVITGDSSHWDRTTTVSIEDIPIVIPLRVQPTKIYGLIVIPGTLFGKFSFGEKTVIVSTGAEICESKALIY